MDIFLWFVDSDVGDYDYELSLEMKRQKIQRELLKLEQENLEKREDMVIKKDEPSAKSRSAALPKVNSKVIIGGWVFSVLAADAF